MDASPKIDGLNFIEQPKYLHARVTASNVTREMAMSILSEVMVECADRKHKKLILERDVSAKVSTDELLKALIEMIRMNSGTKVAFLDRHLTDDECEHLTDAGCRCFQQKPEAEIWLLEDE